MLLVGSVSVFGMVPHCSRSPGRCRRGYFGRNSAAVVHGNVTVKQWLPEVFRNGWMRKAHIRLILARNHPPVGVDTWTVQSIERN